MKNIRIISVIALLVAGINASVAAELRADSSDLKLYDIRVAVDESARKLAHADL